MDRDKFYEQAIQPEFDDHMIFQLDVTNPENPNSFSAEGVNDIMDQVQSFVLARTMGNWEKLHRPPKHMKMAVVLSFDTKPHDQTEIQAQEWPWFAGETDDLGLSQVEGSKRIPRKFPIDK